MTNRELLELIGEIDGITLQSVGSGVAVYLRIGDRDFELIKDCGDLISHHITRIGIGSAIKRGGQPIGTSIDEMKSHASAHH